MTLKPPKQFDIGGTQPPDGQPYRLAVLRIPSEPEMRRALNAQLTELCYPSRWRADVFANTTPLEVAAWFTKMFSDFMGDSPMLGVVAPYLTDKPPTGMLPMDGSVYLRADYPRLWEVLPANLKTETEIMLPNMREFFVRGRGVTQAIGEQGGSEVVTIGVEHLPSHTHTTQPHFHGFIGTTPIIGEVGAGVPIPIATSSPQATDAATVTVNPTGDGEMLDIPNPPYIAMNYGIWYV